MYKYLRLPTHQKNGWLFYLIGAILFFTASNLLEAIEPVFSSILGFLYAGLLLGLIIEVIATITGKNKPETPKLIDTTDYSQFHSHEEVRKGYKLNVIETEKPIWKQVLILILVITLPYFLLKLFTSLILGR